MDSVCCTRCCSKCWHGALSELYGVAVTDVRSRIRELCVLVEDRLAREAVEELFGRSRRLGLSEAV